MACRFLILALVLWAGRACGSPAKDVTAACCGHFRQLRWKEYVDCIHHYATVPVCDGSMRGCYYGDRFYAVGETVEVIPSKCIKFVCACVTVDYDKDDDHMFAHGGDGGQLVADNSQTVQMKIVHVDEGCGCCKHEDQMYPEGTKKILDRNTCGISICNDGEWTLVEQGDDDFYDYYYYDIGIYERNFDNFDDGDRLMEDSHRDDLNGAGYEGSETRIYGIDADECERNCNTEYQSCKTECGMDDKFCHATCENANDICTTDCESPDRRRLRVLLAKPSSRDLDSASLHSEKLDGSKRMEPNGNARNENDCVEELANCEEKCSENDQSDCNADCLEEFQICITTNNSQRALDNDPSRAHSIGYSYSRTCCRYDGKYYFDGETIELHIGTNGRDCWKLFCCHGYITRYFYTCCCVEGDEMYSCYSTRPLPSSDHETCNFRKCCDGEIETKHHPGCCFDNGQLYKNGEYIGYTPGLCQRKQCVDGEVVYWDTGYCCKDNGNYYQCGDIVESNPRKCILKVCDWWGRIVDYSLDSCPCCLRHGRLYSNGSLLYTGLCATIQCIDGKWIDNCYPSNCDYCYIGTHYKTFDNLYYQFNGYCNSTLLQFCHSSFGCSDSFFGVYLSYKKCSVPFSDHMACNDVLTIRHFWNTLITIRPGGYVEVNGDPVTDLPYERSYLLIYETPFAIRVITLLGFVIEYGKAYNPHIKIYAPIWAYNTYVYGLCGTYDGRPDNDLALHPHYLQFTYYGRLETFFNSWEAPDTICCEDDRDHGRNCSSLTIEEVDHIKEDCEHLYEHISCEGAYLNNSAYAESCIAYICACEPCMEETCFVYLFDAYSKDCARIGGDVHDDCNGEHGGHGSTTTWSSSSSAFIPGLFETTSV